MLIHISDSLFQFQQNLCLNIKCNLLIVHLCLNITLCEVRLKPVFAHIHMYWLLRAVE